MNAATANQILQEMAGRRFLSHSLVDLYRGGSTIAREMLSHSLSARLILIQSVDHLSYTRLISYGSFIETIHKTFFASKYAQICSSLTRDF